MGATNVRLTSQDIRIFMMDKPEMNPLLNGIRFDDKDIDHAMINVVDAYNTFSPPTGFSYTVENFPLRHLLLIGTAAWLLKGAAINQASNNLTYSLDGVQVNDNDKSDIFAKLGSAYWDEFKEISTNSKININVAAAFGSYGSEQILVAR